MRTTFRHSIIVAIILSVLISCATNPVTGKRELMLISEQQEISLGQEYDPQVVAQYGLYDHPELQQFIADIGTDMAKISHRSQLQYHFRLLDTPVINAFAVPGGYVYITRGILAYLNSEAEFAGVMGHEIGHITARHTAKQQSKAQLAQLGLGLGSVLSSDVAAYAGLASQGLGLLFLKFGRDAERQSDQLGVEYSTSIGYDAHEMANFFATLDKMVPESGVLPSFLSTHPNPADRVVSVQNMATEEQEAAGGSNYKINRNEFLRRLDGLVFGNDPKHGYVENNVFYHPDLLFRFNVPANWQVINTPTQVQLVSDDQNAAIQLSLQSGGTPLAAAESFITETGATKVDGNSVTVGGYDAYRMTSDLTTENGVLRIRSYAIKYGQNIYMFHGFSAQDGFGNYESHFESSISSFKRLTDQSKINVTPDRIRVKSVARDATLKSALKYHKVKDDQLDMLALVNGMELTDRVKKGTLIKIVAK